MNPGMFTTVPLSHGRSRRALMALAVIALAALMLALQQAGASPAGAQVEVPVPTDITGRVVNGTEGGVIPPTLQVYLLVVDEAQQTVIGTQQQVVGENGEFAFSGYITGPGITYRVVADNGAHTPSVDLRAGESSFENVEITIWDSTGAFDDIRFSLYSMIVPPVDGGERLMGAITLVKIVNSGDRVWLPPDLTQQVTGLDLLRFNLPEGYQELSVETTLPPASGGFDQLLDIGTGFALTNPVPPGEYDVIISYIIEYSGNALDFPLRLAYGADEVRITIAEGVGDVTGMGLGAGEAISIESDNFTLYRGRDYAPGAQLDVRIGSLPTPNLLESLRNFFEGRAYIIVVAWIVVAAVIGLLAYALFFARQRRKSASAALAEFPEYKGLKRAQIVETIAELDGRHDAGEIDDDEYRARREALKRAALATRRTETQPI